MTSRRTLAIALSPLLIGLSACGSSGSTNSAPSVLDAQTALQAAQVAGDATKACLYIDEAALKAQVAKINPAAKKSTCVAIMTAVMTLKTASHHAVKPLKSAKVLSQSATDATVQITTADGQTQFATWKLEGGTWKVVSTQ